MTNLEIVHESPKYFYCMCPNPKHGKPDVCVTKDGPYRGKWYCWGCGWSGTVTEEWMSKFKKKLKSLTDIDWTELNKAYQNNIFSSMEGDKAGIELAKIWDINYKYLAGLNIGWDGKACTFPMLNEQDFPIGIHRRFLNGWKCSVEESRMGLFIGSTSFGDFNDYIFICEGLSDTAVALDLCFDAIGRASCKGQEKMIGDWLWNHDIKEVTIIADNDEPGQNGAYVLQGYLQKRFLGMTVSILTPSRKDLRESVKVDGKEKVKQILEAEL